MTVSIKIDHTCSCLEEVCTQVNNALLARVRKIKKRGGPWPKVKFLSISDGTVFYKVGE